MSDKNKFDIVLNLEVVEHVENLDLYLQSCSQLIKNWRTNVYSYS